MESEPQRKNLGQISKKLIEGWSLLKDDCPNPNCKTALISKDNKIFCANCENYFRKDGNGMLWYTRLEDSIPSIQSSILDQPKPLPPPPSFGEIPKVTNHNGFVENGNNDILSQSHTARTLDFSTHTPNRDFPRSFLSTGEQKQRKDGTKVAQRLLDGWTLLYKNCSQCGATLMADKNNRSFCVNCNTFDAGANKTTNGITVQSPARWESSHLSLDNGRNPSAILESTIKSLYDKMEAARELLDHTTNISDCNKLVSLIAECGNSIKILQSISLS